MTCSSSPHANRCCHDCPYAESGGYPETVHSQNGRSIPEERKPFFGDKRDLFDMSAFDSDDFDGDEPEVDGE